MHRTTTVVSADSRPAGPPRPRISLTPHEKRRFRPALPQVARRSR